MANIAFHNFLFLLIALTESSCAAASVHVASQSACSEESWSSDAGDDVCLLQFLDRGRTAQAQTQTPTQAPTHADRSKPRWTLVFRQSLGDYDWPTFRKNADNPGADNYAILDELERFRGQDGKFKFKFRWEGVADGPQIWKQSSNPTTSQHPVQGYESVKDGCGSAKRWDGLALGLPQYAKIDGTPGKWWWYAVMAGRAFKGGIPACSGSARRTELYVWNENPPPPPDKPLMIMSSGLPVHALEAPGEPCCGANPTQSTASSGTCHEAGVDVFARHQDLLKLFGDNVAMNPNAYKFFLEGACEDINGELRCTYTAITDPDVYGHEFPVGRSNVKIKGIDISGNSYECIKTLYVYDDEPPVFTTPVDERASAVVYPVNDTTCNVANNGPFDAYEGLGFSATASDNCDRDVTIVKQIFDEAGVTKLYDSRDGNPHGSFTQGPGVYRLVYVAIDDYSENISFPEKRNNHRTTHSATLVLEDRASPTRISACPANINVTIEPHELETEAGNVTWTVPHVTEDNCLHVIPALDAEEVNGTKPGMRFPVGATRVKYVFKDGSNNVYPEECKFTVTVVQKKSPVELTCPADITVTTLKHASFALVSWAAPVATQGDISLDVIYPQGVESGMPFPFGITDVKVKAVGTLPAGVKGDRPVAECFFTVTVQDPEDPMCDSRTLQCAAESPLDKPGMAPLIKPYGICEGPQLEVTRHADFKATLEYETVGVLTPSYSSCCTSEPGVPHECVPAAPGSPTKYCTPAESSGANFSLLGDASESADVSGVKVESASGAGIFGNVTTTVAPSADFSLLGDASESADASGVKVESASGAGIFGNVTTTAAPATAAPTTLLGAESSGADFALLGAAADGADASGGGSAAGTGIFGNVTTTAAPATAAPTILLGAASSGADSTQ